jgi:glutathione S-transferase
VPAGFVGEDHLGVFESNSILRSVARESQDQSLYGGDDSSLTSRIDSFLDANLVFSREFQVYLLELEDITTYTYERTKAAYEFYLDGLERSLTSNSFLAGDHLTIADISFACEFAQFLREGHYLDQLESKNLSLISKNFKTDYPLTFNHFKTLCEKKEFADVMGTYLDWYKM